MMHIYSIGHIVTPAVFLAGLTTRLTKSACQSSMGVWIWNLVLFDRVPPAVQAVYTVYNYTTIHSIYRLNGESNSYIKIE